MLCVIISQVCIWLEMVEKSKEKHNKLFISFECETLKADKQAKDHISRYLPHLIGHEAVVNIGTMKIRGLNFDSDDHLAHWSPKILMQGFLSQEVCQVVNQKTV